MRRRGVLHANGADDERALSSREGSGQAVGPFEVAVPDGSTLLAKSSSESGERETRISSDAGTRPSNAATTRRPSFPEAPVTIMRMNTLPRRTVSDEVTVPTCSSAPAWSASAIIPLLLHRSGSAPLGLMTASLPAPQH